MPPPLPPPGACWSSPRKETTGTSNNLAKTEISSATTSSKVEHGSGVLTKTEEPSNDPSPPIKKKETRHREPLDPVRTNLNALIFQSLLVVLFTLATVWLSRGQPLLIASVWELSLLISLSSLLWVNFLKVAMRARMVFLYLSHGVLLAVIAHLTLSPKIGMLTVHLNTHVAAGLLGYTLAECRLFEATEKYDIPMVANKEQAERLRGLRIATGLYCGLVTLVAAVGVAWVVCHAADYATNDLLLLVLMPFPGILVFWISFVAALLRGALMGHGGLGLLYAYFGLIAMVYMLSLVTLGHTAATINTWLGILGVSGMFGYSLCVYDSYKEILGMEYVQRDNKESPLKAPSSPPSAEKL